MLYIDRNGFQFDGQGYVIVYIDGSCENNGMPNAKAGFGVYFGPNNPLNRGLPVSGRATNNAAEIQAATAAIQLAETRDWIRGLCIRTDSQFLLDSVLNWMDNWKKNNWKKPNGNPVENRDDFRKLDVAMQRCDFHLKWQKVRAHSGDYGNDKADELAKQGAEEYRG